MLKVSVIDKGKGIEKDEMDKLLRLFGKIESNQEDSNDGIGMGLTIC